MIILDWRDPISFGNIVGTSLASEYIRNILREDIGIIPANYYQDVYKLSVPLNRIFTIDNIPPNSVIRVPHLTNYNHQNNIPDDRILPWVHNLIVSAVYFISRDEKLDPSICWLNSSNSKKVLLYPREHHNKNLYFTIDYWVAASQQFIERGWDIVAMLQDTPSHRDGNISVQWCNEFKSKVKCTHIFNPTIQNLQIAVGLCELAFGILSGPFWLMLKSTIKQIVISDPNLNNGIEIHYANFELPFIKKQITHIPDNSLEIISSL